ncbi:MAG: universal stress protein [Candidatus Acidiferrum sp.]
MKPATAKTAAGFHNILFATDFSDAADKAIPYVKRIAKHYEANLLALHVDPPVVNAMTPPETWSASAAAAEASDKAHKEQLLRTFEGIPTKVLIQEGDVQSRLQASINENNIDLVVMGTRGRTGLGKFFLGSVAEEILRKVTCPVLTIGPHADPAREPNGQIREVLYATNLTPRSQSVARYAVSLADEFHARLVLLHVIPSQEPNDLVMDTDVAESAGALLRKLVPAEATAYCEPQYFVEKGNAAEKILELAHLRGADLIVMGVKAEEGAPEAATHLSIATIHKVVANAECPVLTVRS